MPSSLVWWCALFSYCYAATNSNITIPCITPNGEPAFCISLYSCKPLLRSLGSLKPAALAFVRQSQCGLLDSFLVCCGTSGMFSNSFLDPSTFVEQQDLDLTATVKVASTVKPTRKRSATSVATRKDIVTTMPTMIQSTKKSSITSTERSIDMVSDKASLLAGRKYCGLQHTDDRFYGENATAIDEFPWLALLRKFQNGKKVPLCSGAIISHRYVVTIATCVDEEFNITTVQLGLYHREKTVECVENPYFPECTDPAVEVEIEQTITHSKYVPYLTFKNNIALLRLSKTLFFTDYIRPICLPMEWSKRPELDATLSASGWGSQTQYGAELVDIKKRISQKLISNEECNTKNPHIRIDDTAICTSPYAEDENQVCTGDTGGPLMYTYKHQWFMEGVVVGGVGDRNCSGQIISTRITSYMGWILDNIRK